MSRPGDVADRLGHRLGHVGTGLEKQLHHRHALDIPALNVMDARDIKKLILVIVGEKPLHLGWVHAAVGLGEVDDRQTEVGEDVDRLRVTASPLPSTTATTSTMTVKGRRMAKVIGFMGWVRRNVTRWCGF